MHNSLKFFRDETKDGLLAQMVAFMKAENVTGKSISIENNEYEIAALLGYLPGNPDNMDFHFVTLPICKTTDSDEAIQAAIDKAANETGDFVCQSCYIEDQDLAVVFLKA